MFDLSGGDLPIVLLLGTVRPRLPSGDRLRAGSEEQHDGDDEGDEAQDDEPGRAGASGLGILLRHEPTLPHPLSGHPGWLSWVSWNRVWLIPYASAVFVVLVEVIAGVTAANLPAPAHGALGLFWIWALGRGSTRRTRQIQRERKICSVAEALGVEPEQLSDEFALFMAERDLGGKGRGDA